MDLAPKRPSRAAPFFRYASWSFFRPPHVPTRRSALAKAKLRGMTLLLALAAPIVFAVVLLDPPSAALIAGGSIGGTRVIGEQFPKRLIDPLGREHRLAIPPQRIASGTLAGDEMLADLVTPERIVAVSWRADDPANSNIAGFYPATIPRVQRDVEALLTPEPDLVVISSTSDALTVRLLLSAGVAVARVASYDSFAEIEENILLLGAVLGVEGRAMEVVADMRRRIAAVQRRVVGRSAPRVLFLWSRDGSTGGPGSLTDEMIELAGGYNVIRDTGITGHRRVALELAIALQPEIIVVVDWTGRGAAETEWLRQAPAWQDVPAIQNNRLLSLHSAWVTCGSQFRVAGVEVLAQRLHPEAFPNAPY